MFDALVVSLAMTDYKWFFIFVCIAYFIQCIFGGIMNRNIWIRMNRLEARNVWMPPLDNFVWEPGTISLR